MNVSNIRVFPVNNAGRLKARADVTFVLAGSCEVTAKGFRIHDGGNAGLWVGPPSEKYEKGGKPQWKEMLWLNQSAQAELYPKIIAEYKRQLEQNSPIG